MSGNLDETWLDWAVELEEKVNCDISAGLDLGQHIKEYLAKNYTCINREKFLLLLRDDLGFVLEQEELELIVNAAQECARELIKEKLESSEAA